MLRATICTRSRNYSRCRPYVEKPFNRTFCIGSGKDTASGTTIGNPHSYINSADANKKGLIDSMIRVNHAGELGAQRIYEGQMYILKGTSVAPIIQEMQEQETKHLQYCEQLIQKHRVRPTALTPIWNTVGFCIGAGSALLGKEAAMALTVAVEEVISEHYDDQLRTMNNLGYTQDPDDLHLRKVIRESRDDELEHKEIGLHHDAEQTPFYNALTSAVKIGCRTAIWLSTRI